MYKLKPDEHKKSKLFFRSLYISFATSNTLPFAAAVPLAGPRPLAKSLMVIRRQTIYRFRPAHILLVEIMQTVFLYHLGSSHGCQVDIVGYRRLKSNKGRMAFSCAVFVSKFHASPPFVSSFNACDIYRDTIPGT